MKLLFKLITTFLIFGQIVSAQKSLGFYIEPTVSTKLHTYKKSNLPPDMVTEYFTIIPRQFIFTLGTGINLGVNMGYKFNNNDKVQIGLFHDEVTQGIYASGIAVNSFTPVFSAGTSTYERYGGTSCTNFNFIYKRALLNFKNNWAQNNRSISAP